MSEESRQGDKHKREETLIEDYLTEREELTSGPRFHVPPFTVKQIKGTKTTFFAPVGSDPEADLEKMQKGAAPAAPGGPGKPPAEKAAEPVRKPAQPAMVRMMEARVPKAFAALQARALGRANGPAPEEEGTPEEAEKELEKEAGEPEAEPAPKAAPPPPEPEAPAPPPGPRAPMAPPPAPKPAPTTPPPAREAPPGPNVIDVTAARVKAAAEEVAGEAEASAGGPAGQAAAALEPSRPLSFRKPFMKPDTFGAKRTGLPPLPRKVSAKELIARLRVVREGVETHDQIVQRMGAAQKPPAAEEEAPEPEQEAPAKEEGAGEAASGPEAGAVVEEEPPAAAESAPAGTAADGRTEGGKLCPSCGTPITEKNRLLICTDCGRQNCDTCGRYEKSHMKSDVFYEYQFDWPLCLTCYEKAYTIQRMLGRASVCYGNGNYSYAMWYANNALSQDPNSRYAPKIKDIIEKINKANKAAGERDREWRFARKHFARQPAEDPRWRQ